MNATPKEMSTIPRTTRPVVESGGVLDVGCSLEEPVPDAGWGPDGDDSDSFAAFAAFAAATAAAFPRPLDGDDAGGVWESEEGLQTSFPKSFARRASTAPVCSRSQAKMHARTVMPVSLLRAARVVKTAARTRASADARADPVRTRRT